VAELEAEVGAVLELLVALLELPPAAAEAWAAVSTMPPKTELGELLELVWAAADLYAASVFPLDGWLTTMTMPDWQWLPAVCAQYSHIGSVLLTLTLKTSWSAGKPEKIPPSMGWHGLEKVDWVTEWKLPPLKTKLMVSPIAAVNVSGVNVKPLAPTWTVWTD